MRGPAQGNGVIELRAVHRSYEADEARVDAVRGIDLTIDRGEFVAVIGPSGSGKSTVLNLMGALDQPTSGEVLLNGRPLAKCNRTELARIRGSAVGFVFQAFNLVPGITAAENVALPAVLLRKRPAEYRDEVARLLDLVGLSAKADRLPGQLSGGEQQRVAFARALVMDPPILLADEPTGNLDTTAGEAIIDLLEASHNAGRTIVLVTHDMRLASRAQRIVHLRDGEITHITCPPSGRDRRLEEILEVGEPERR
ncbi:MAG: putative transport system ATP-binding protein [Acidimicrobiaceae bacterium]